MHPKYEFHEFYWRFQLRARFELKKIILRVNFGDILEPRKIPEFTLIMISDLKRQNSRNSPYVEHMIFREKAGISNRFKRVCVYNGRTIKVDFKIYFEKI